MGRQSDFTTDGGFFEEGVDGVSATGGIISMVFLVAFEELPFGGWVDPLFMIHDSTTTTYGDIFIGPLDDAFLALGT
jgi:hypothetical protein